MAKATDAELQTDVRVISQTHTLQVEQLKLFSFRFMEALDAESRG